MPTGFNSLDITLIMAAQAQAPGTRSTEAGGATHQARPRQSNTQQQGARC